MACPVSLGLCEERGNVGSSWRPFFSRRHSFMFNFSKSTNSCGPTLESFIPRVNSSQRSDISGDPHDETGPADETPVRDEEMSDAEPKLGWSVIHGPRCSSTMFPITWTLFIGVFLFFCFSKEIIHIMVSNAGVKKTPNNDRKTPRHRQETLENLLGGAAAPCFPSLGPSSLEFSSFFASPRRFSSVSWRCPHRRSTLWSPMPA
jgi:hypothetical protein